MHFHTEVPKGMRSAAAARVDRAMAELPIDQPLPRLFADATIVKLLAAHESNMIDALSLRTATLTAIPAVHADREHRFVIDCPTRN